VHSFLEIDIMLCSSGEKTNDEVAKLFGNIAMPQGE
jgi:hypothetical protein